MLVTRVIEHQFGDDPKSAPMCFLQEAFEILEIAVCGMYAGVVGDVVAVIAPR